MKTLEQVHNRRKAFVYVSNGYDFNPFSETRKKNDQEKWNEMNPNAGSSDGSNSSAGTGDGSNANDVNPFMQAGNEFSFADLASELSELTREANRANTTIYTIDPRGLVGMPDLDQNVDMMDFQNYIRTSQNSLRVLVGADRRFCDHQPERLHEGVEAYRCRDQRLLRDRLLLVESRSDDAETQSRDQSQPPEPGPALPNRYTLKPTKAPAQRADVDVVKAEAAEGLEPSPRELRRTRKRAARL